MKKLNKKPVGLTKMKFTISSDPEVHIFDTIKNRIVSSIPVMKNDKYSPLDLGKGIKAYADSVLTEVALPVAKNKKEFINNFKESFSRLQKKLGNRYRLIPKSAHKYDDEELKDKAAWEIGCSSTFCPYKQSVNNPGGFKNNVRTGSTHIHLGNKKLQMHENRELASKILDVFVGCSSVLFDKDDTAAERRLLYGQSGEMRFPAHGLEWRVLGGNVLSSPKIMDLVFDLVDHSLTFIESGTAQDILNKVNEKDVTNAINLCDKELAEKVLIQAGLPNDLLNRAKEEYSYDLYANWGIKA